MSTKKCWRMDVEMALGHGLQHIGQLYAAQTSATTDQHALRKRIQALEGDVKTLQTSIERLQTVENSLSTLQQSIAAWQATDNSPTTPKPDAPRPKAR